MSTLSLSSYLGLEEDPPVPPGATKLSYSVRMSNIKLRLCNTDLDFLDFEVIYETLKGGLRLILISRSTVLRLTV